MVPFALCEGHEAGAVGAGDTLHFAGWQRPKAPGF